MPPSQDVPSDIANMDWREKFLAGQNAWRRFQIDRTHFMPSEIMYRTD